METAELLLDARGLICPLPVLKARKLLKSLPSGAVLRILVTDPGAPRDFAHFCETTGVSLMAVDTHDGHVEIILRQSD